MTCLFSVVMSASFCTGAFGIVRLQQLGVNEER